jgi:hypothetical protein
MHHQCTLQTWVLVWYFKKVQGSRFKVQGSRFKVQGSRFKVQGSRFKVQGSRFNKIKTKALLNNNVF